MMGDGSVLSYVGWLPKPSQITSKQTPTSSSARALEAETSSRILRQEPAWWRSNIEVSVVRAEWGREKKSCQRQG